MLSFSHCTDFAFAKSSRVIGGQNAALGQFPHQVYLNLTVGKRSAFCGGALIHPQIVRKYEISFSEVSIY